MYAVDMSPTFNYMDLLSMTEVACCEKCRIYSHGTLKMVYAYIPVGSAPNALKVDAHVHVEFYVAREQSTVIHVRAYLAVYMNLL